MENYIDFQFKQGEYAKVIEYHKEDAIILAIRNIILSKPGNFPFHPKIGLNIKQYKFNLLDDEGVREIERDLNRQIAEYIPDTTGIDVQLRKVEDSNGTPYLGIAVGRIIDGNSSINFLMRNDGKLLEVFNEIS